MNKWDCEFPGCDNSCVGVGGAIGLRAIGWDFMPGFNSKIFCPVHRKEYIKCHENGQLCSICTANFEADIHQEQIKETVKNIIP